MLWHPHFRISQSFLHYSTPKENLNSRHTSSYCALLYWTSQVLWFTKWKFVASLWPSVSVPFPQHLLFLYLCHILGILVIFHFYYCICDWWFLGNYERKSAANFIILSNCHSHPNLSNPTRLSQPPSTLRKDPTTTTSKKITNHWWLRWHHFFLAITYF